MMAVQTTSTSAVSEYVTATVGQQLFGISISRVQDVFKPERLTRVPMASTNVAGVLNLRGRILTAIDMRARLGLTGGDVVANRMAIGVDQRGESYGLLIDAVGEVLQLDSASREAVPVNLDPQLARLAAGVHRLDGQLLVILDIDRVLELAADDLST